MNQGEQKGEGRRSGKKTAAPSWTIKKEDLFFTQRNI
jgi:hypothetical protein